MRLRFLIATALILGVIGWAAPVLSLATHDTNQSEDTVYKPSEVTRKARITYKTEPAYTEEARNHHVRGTVILEMVLRVSGEVTDITVVKGLPHGLTEQCIKTARAMKFESAIKDDRKVSQYQRAEYEFLFY